MKKIVFLITVAVIIIAILPIIGNKYIENELSQRVVNLESFGMDVKKIDIQSTYFSSKKKFEFSLKDTDKFLEYLSRYSKKQLPPYTKAMIDGVRVGVDLEYSNFPFSKAISLNIYPLTLSNSMRSELKDLDLDFYNYIDKFLHSKGVLYHLNYNILSQDFDGYVKDIDEYYTLKGKTEISLKLKNVIYHGNGELIAPKLLLSSMELVSLKVLQEDIHLDFNLQKVSTSSNFESQSTYISSAGVENFDLLVRGMSDTLSLKTSDIKINVSSNTQGQNAEMFSKTSFQNLNVSSKELSFDIKEFNSDISIKGIDKDSLEEFRLLVLKTQTNNTLELEERITKALYSVLSHGVLVDIADFSVKDIVVDGNSSLDAFSLRANFELKEDKNFIKKVEYMPIALASSINTNIKFKLSKKIFTKLLKLYPMIIMSKKYAKDEGSSLIFDITFINGELRVNGKALQN